MKTLLFCACPHLGQFGTVIEPTEQNKNIKHFMIAPVDLFLIHNLMFRNIRGFNNAR